MLRDAMTRLDGVDTWPCDEINPIWRHGNISWPNDEIPPERATQSVKRFIRNAFRRIWRDCSKPGIVIEKTCANTLRVPFIDAVLPEAKYIHIVRDGVDVVASAQKRWRGDLEVPSFQYYWSKIKYAPVVDLPAYSWRFLKNRIAMRRNSDSRMDIWGPHFEGMDDMAESPLDEVCAAQWQACVGKTGAALAAMDPSRVHTVHYEDVTADPARALSEIMQFLNSPRSDEAITEAVSSVSRRSVGKGRQNLSGDVDRLLGIMRPALERYGYEA